MVSGQVLIAEPHITIKYDVLEDILYAEWSGEQNHESVIDGCEKILTYLQLYRCSKILNDNTQITSIWSDASEWIAEDWFPRLVSAGCKYFAHVYSPDPYSKLSADKALNHGIRDAMVTAFIGRDTAEAWLKAVK